MPSNRVCAPLLAALFLATPLFAQPPDRPLKAQVELRWVESKPIEGVTEKEGYQTSCDPDSIMYPHRKAALVLTSAEVAEVKLKEHDFSRSGGAKANYMVAFHLTKEARDKLAATTTGNEMKFLTVVIDGRPWGLHRYEKDSDKPFVPQQCRAESFLPEVGFFSSRFDAQRVVKAVQRP